MKPHAPTPWVVVPAIAVGKDSLQPGDFPHYSRGFETNDVPGLPRNRFPN